MDGSLADEGVVRVHSSSKDIQWHLCAPFGTVASEGGSSRTSEFTLSCVVETGEHDDLLGLSEDDRPSASYFIGRLDIILLGASIERLGISHLHDDIASLDTQLARVHSSLADERVVTIDHGADDHSWLVGTVSGTTHSELLSRRTLEDTHAPFVHATRSLRCR